MYSRAGAAEYSTVSAMWNASYDVGMALGALVAGPVIAATGYGAGFLVTAAAMTPALLLARRESASHARVSNGVEAALRSDPVPA
jgi:predicted MFS family arabinose efflux permease